MQAFNPVLCQVLINTGGGLAERPVLYSLWDSMWPRTPSFYSLLLVIRPT